jgi:hypothetical protein
MEALADSVNSRNNWSIKKHFKLMNDITDSVRSIIGIGLTRDGDIASFQQAHFDGQGHTITLAISGKDYYNDIDREHHNHQTYGYYDYPTGLFGVVIGTSIKNLAVKGYVKNFNEPIIFSIATGGIVAVVIGADNKITNCLNSADIMGVGCIGGIAGMVTGGNIIIEKCINIGTIRTSGQGRDYFFRDSSSAAGGGIIGACSGMYVTTNNCINSGFIEGDDCIGGIVGNHAGFGINANLTMSNCISTGVVKGKTNTGCIVGKNLDGIIINCHYDKQMCGGEE